MGHSGSKKTLGGKTASDPAKAIPFKAFKKEMCAQLRTRNRTDGTGDKARMTPAEEERFKALSAACYPKGAAAFSRFIF